MTDVRCVAKSQDVLGEGPVWVTAEDRGVVPLFRLKADGTGFAAVHKEGAANRGQHPDQCRPAFPLWLVLSR